MQLCNSMYVSHIQFKPVLRDHSKDKKGLLTQVNYCENCASGV